MWEVKCWYLPLKWLVTLTTVLCYGAACDDNHKHSRLALCKFFFVSNDGTNWNQGAAKMAVKGASGISSLLAVAKLQCATPLIYPQLQASFFQTNCSKKAELSQRIPCDAPYIWILCTLLTCHQTDSFVSMCRNSPTRPQSACWTACGKAGLGTAMLT